MLGQAVGGGRVPAKSVAFMRLKPSSQPRQHKKKIPELNRKSLPCSCMAGFTFRKVLI
jgi:hypothetical protein